MYKHFFKKSRISIAINTFPKTAKRVSTVYNTGIRIFNADTHKTYSLVIHLFRIMIYVNHTDTGTCQ
jgi:hypothetical protein